MIYDAVVLSDLHLGAATCQVQALQDLLETLPPTARLILNGDVLENTEYRLTKQHWRILTTLRKLSDQVDLVWVAGNHDYDADSVANLIGARFVTEYRFVSGGKSILCVHGDNYDRFITDHPYLTFIADWFYLRMQGWSRRLAIKVKKNSKTFIRCIDHVREKALEYAKAKKVDMIITGHTHCAESVNGYYNTGCWTDHNCHYLLIHNGAAQMVEVSVDVAK